MQKRTLVYTLTLATITAAGLGSAAMADRMGGGHGMPGMMGMMGGPGPMFDFDAIDADKDGKITPEEMTAHRAARVAEIDANKDGKISADELTAMHMKAAEARAKDHVAQMITHMDSDGDGALSAAELLAMPGPGPKMMERVDTDGDGAISKAEMEAAQARMAEWKGKRHGKGHGKPGHGPDMEQDDN
ncbi:EF-hand domain-containing protein [Gemmobacter fulva]|nr:EF-hand domain-containing protein [Gemmobacter fulvus]